jgi:hypothetical protein
VIDLIAETPLVKQALAAHQAAIALQRSTQIKELARLQRDWAKIFPGLEAALAAAIAAVKAADLAALEARRRLDIAAGAKAQGYHRFTSSVDRLENQLRQTAEPALKEFRSEMLDALDKARRAAAWSSAHDINEVTGAGRTITVNNLASVHARTDAIRAAMAAAEELALSELDQSLIPGRLQELRAALPAIDSVLAP